MPIDTPLVLALPGNEELALDLAQSLAAKLGRLTLHRFPDGELSVRIHDQVEARDVVLACTLDQPNDKLIALYLAAATLRSLRARRVLLAAPYLAYMRQDRSFHPGEGVSAAHIAQWLSGFLDGLATVDPHLHRIAQLELVYRIPCRAAHAATAIARWIRENVNQPVVVGPDRESQGWASEVAHEVSCPWVVFDKVRFGDRDVEIHPSSLSAYQDRTPVILDDIISSGATMLAAMRQTRLASLAPAVCIGVHGLFTAGVYEQLRHGGAQAVVTSNSVRHISNQIDVHPPLATAVRGLLELRPEAAKPNGGGH